MVDRNMVDSGTTDCANDTNQGITAKARRTPRVSVGHRFAHPAIRGSAVPSHRFLINGNNGG
jgi:hypothetical protein